MPLNSRSRNLIAFVGFTGLTMLVGSGCEVDGTAIVSQSKPKETSPSANPMIVRQTDSEGQPLPFVTLFPNRWSSGNDGTTYEPCTAISAQELRSLDLIPETASDAAVADHQTVRGCTWFYRNSETPSMSQSVGNAKPIAEYKAQLSTTMDWLPDITISNRVVAIGSLAPDTCSTATRSGRANVVTMYSVSPVDPPPLPTLCAKALEFTRATIDKMPP